MVSLQKTKIVEIKLSSTLRQQRLVPPDDELVKTARCLGVSFGDNTNSEK